MHKNKLALDQIRSFRLFCFFLACLDNRSTTNSLSFFFFFFFFGKNFYNILRQHTSPRPPLVNSHAANRSDSDACSKQSVPNSCTRNYFQAIGVSAINNTFLFKFIYVSGKAIARQHTGVRERSTTKSRVALKSKRGTVFTYKEREKHKQNTTN